MYCDNCSKDLDMDFHDYLKQKQAGGRVTCALCSVNEDESVLQRIRSEMHVSA